MSETPSLDQRFADAMGQCLGPDFPTDIALAVSGGGDSMAMLTLAHNWARIWGVRLWVVTVDHGLRPESGAEAAMVAEEARLLGHKHSTLKWHWDGQGNVQAAAREARLDLIDRWRGLIEHVLFAHTSDDVAETFLMRLARQAGVEGLAEMRRSRFIERRGGRALREQDHSGDLPPQWHARTGPLVRPGGFTLHRPCLAMSRVDLRHYLKTLQGRWVEDPSNGDPRFDRVRMRGLLPDLAAAGLSKEALVTTARRMARASEALRLRAAERFDAMGQEGRVGGEPTGEILFDRAGFEATDRETQMRLLSYACTYISSQAYRPREAPLDDLLDRLLGGGGGTLHGCELRMERALLRISREYQAVAKTTETLGPEGGPVKLWDTRWRLPLHALSDVERRSAVLRALGQDGWEQIGEQIGERPDGAPPFYAARALPSVWVGDRLVSCTALGVGNGLTTLWPMGREFYNFRRFLLSH